MEIQQNKRVTGPRSIFAITGKGGAGKTTVAALLISRLIKKEKKPVLAIDADPNTCLDQALGVNAIKTIGNIREEAKKAAGKGLSSGISKQRMLEMEIAESLVETENFDYIAMGRPEGPGCYCYANNLLREVLGKISNQYPFVVLDNEAGLENLSRRIYQNVDLLIMVSDPSWQGISTVGRLHELAGEMEIHYKKLVIMVNRLRSPKQPQRITEIQKRTHAHMVLELPENEEVSRFAEQGKSLLGLPESNEVVNHMDQFLTNIGVFK
jgi:CO dehydrogenase maturation factor